MTKEDILSYLDGEIEACKAAQEALTADSRKDEAVLQKIRGNVFDIFRTVFVTAQQRTSDEAAFRAFIENNLTNIPRGWKAAYAQAEAHNDAIRLAQEQVKLTALSEVETELRQLWG